MKSSYVLRSLDEVLTLALDQHQVQVDAEYPIAGVYGFGRGLFVRESIAGSETRYRSLNRLRGGLVVLSRLKAFEGAIAVSPNKFAGFFLSPEFPTFAIDQGKADINYIKHMCSWPDFWIELRRGSKGIGARRERVSVDKLLATEVPIPDLDEQRRIAAKLDSSYEKIQRAFNLIERSRDLRKNALAVSLAEVQKSAPMRDFLSQANDIVEVVPEDRYETAGLYNYGRGIFRRPVIYGSETKYTRYNRLRGGQFIYSKLFSWEGSAAVVPEDFDGVFVSQEFPTFEIDSSVADPVYVHHLTRWPGLGRKLGEGKTGMGSRRQRVNVDQLLATKVPLPDLSTQRVLVGRFDKLQRAENEHAKQEEHLKALRSSLLNAAFSGQL